jgi:hypothetical protein
MKRIYTLFASLFVLATSASWAQTQASAITFEPVPGTPTSLKINWTEGTATAGRIVVIKDALGTFKPTNGTDITTLGANSNYTSATDKDPGSGVVKIVAAIAGSGASVTVSNLVANSRYFVQIYEFTGTSISPTYLLTTNSTNPRSFTFYTTNGSFSVPIDVTSVRVQAWGAGGGGGGANGTGTATTERGGGGGAGGSYTLSNSVAVIAGASIPLTIGTGGAGGIGTTPTSPGGTGGTTSFSSAIPINAVGGLGGATGVGGSDTGAGAIATVGVTFNGGAGANAPGINPDAVSGGGGGGGAGTTGNGGNATNATAGAAGANGGGIGAAGQTITLSGIAATEIAGGGGGAYTRGADGDVNVNGGVGGNGFMIVSFNDNSVPIVTSINRQTPAGSPANATTVTFQVTFNEPVTNVTLDDFVNGGTAGAGTISVSPVSSSVYNVQISGLSSGTVDLNFAANDIVDLSNNAFGGTVTTEQTYTLDSVVPTISTAVASPSTGLLKIGDQVVITLTAGGAETGLVAGAGSTINGQAATFNEVGGGTYTFTYTIASTNSNWAAGALPFNLILNDGVNNSTAQTTFSTANTMAGDANAPTNQNTIFAANRAATPGGTVTLVAGTATDFNFLAPTGTTNFVANGTTITSAAGNATSITAPTTEGDYQLFVVDPAGNFSAASTATLSVFTQASITVADFIAPGGTTQLNFGWNNGTGGNRLVILKTSGATGYTINPGTTYAPNLAFGSGTDLNGGTAGTVKSIYDGNTSALSAAVTGLTAGTVYTIEIYEYKGVKVYLSPPATINRSTSIGTTTTAAPSGMTFSAIGSNTISVQFAQGAANTGTSSMLIARAGSAVSFTTPVDGLSYPANADYSLGTEVGPGGDGNKVIAYRDDASSGTPIIVSGLSPDVVYHFAVFGFSGVSGDGSENYSSPAFNIGNRSTAPSTLATPQAFTAVGETSMTLNWTNTGNGDRRMVVMRPGAAITAAEHPSENTTYTASSNFNFGSPTGTAIGAGYVVYDGTGTSVSLTNLLPGTTYHFAIFEYNNTTSQAAPNQAFLTPGATASQATNADATIPSNAFTVGALTPIGGRVVKNGTTTTYWNSTNTQLSVVVPLSTTDGTLDGGTVQVKLRMTGGAFANIPGSGLSTISAGERAAGTKTVTINQADLENVSTGLTEGNVSGLFSSETKYMQITAETSDLTGNLSGNYTTSITQIDVDQIPPAISGSVRVSPHAGGGNKDAILFQMNEILSDHAATPAQLAHNFAFISASNNYGNPGISVDDGNTDDVKYLNDGAVNTIDGSLTNTRLIRIISANNAATWDVASATNVQYVQLGTGSTAAAVMRDPAGNEFGAITVPVVAGSQTTLAAATAVAGPNLNNGSTNQAVFAFALTSTANVTLQALSIISTVDPTNKLKSFRLFTNSTNNSATAVNSGAASTIVTSAPFAVNFNTLSINLTAATTTYFFLVADVEDYFFSLNPTIAFSMAANGLPNAAGGFTVSSGGVAGTTQTGTTYTLKDLTAPSILSITNTVNPIFEGALTQTVNVIFSEPMNTATNPAITISGGNWSASAPSGGTNGWFTTTLPNDSYKATLIHNGTQELNATASATVAALANGTDWGGNKNALAANSASFVLDTQKPTATLTATTTATSNKLVNSTNLALTVQVTYGEAMNTSFPPTITLAPANANFTPAAGVWSGGNTIYTRVYTHNGTAEEIPSIVVSANGGRDANGNTQTVAAATSGSTNILIDTQRPIVSSITRNNPQFTNGPSVSYTVVFNEAVSGVSESDFTPVPINGSVSTGTIFPGGVTPISATTYTVAIQGLTGDGDTRLDVVNGTATITDANGNSFNTTFNTGEIYSIDNTQPTVTSIVVDPAIVNGYAAAVNGVTPSLHGNTVSYLVTFSEPVSGVNITGLEFNGKNFPNLINNVKFAGGPTVSPVGPAPTSQWKVSGTYVSGAGTVAIDYAPGANAILQTGSGTINSSVGDPTVNGAGGTNFFEMIPGDNMYDTNGNYIGTVQNIGTPTKLNLINPAELNISGTGFKYATPSLTFGTGTITSNNGSSSIVGSGTLFLNEVSANDVLLDPSGNFIGQVKSVNNTNFSIELRSISNLTYSGAYQISHAPSYTSTIVDQAGNTILTKFKDGGYANISLDQPSAVAAITPVPAPLQVTVNWADVSNATHYLVMLKNNAGTFPVAGSPSLNDGVYISDDSNLADGLLVQNIAQGTGSALFTGLNSGTAYSVIIYAYTLDDNCIVAGNRSAINYNLTPATNTTTTTTSNSSTLTLTSTPVAVSSLANNSATSVGVLSFNITDDGTTPAVDNAPFMFNRLVISNGNIGVNWQNVLAGAVLTDGVNSQTIDFALTPSALTPTSIDFSSINTTINNLGFVPDNSAGTSKGYTLKVWLKNPLGVNDNSILRFVVNNSSFTFEDVANNQLSSRLRTLPVQSVNSGNNTVNVVATALAFTTQPIPNAGGANQYVLTNFTGLPVIKSVDANGNVDTDFITPVSITNASGDQMNPGNTTSLSITPVAGVINFPANFQYTDQVAGPTFNGTLTATGGGINSNSGAGFVACTPITVRYSNLTTITAGTLNNLSINSIANTTLAAVPVFDFKVIDDGAASVGDGADTRISQIVIVQGPTNGSTITNWSQVIQGAILSDGVNSMTLDIVGSPAAFTSSTITFAGIPNSNGSLGHVAEGAAGKTYTLRIFLKPITAIPATLDLKNLTFAVNNTASNFVTTSLSSALAPAQSQASTVSQNEIRVYGTQLRFITNLISPLLPAKDISLQQTTPQLEITDANGNRDLNYSAPGTVSIANNGGISMNPGTANPIFVSPSSGLINFPTNQQFLSTSSPLGVTVTIAAPVNEIGGAVTSATQAGVVIQAAQSTRIANGTTAPATISSLATTSIGAVSVFYFDVKDDFGAAPAADDGLPTLISSLTVTPTVGGSNEIADWSQAIAGAELWSGSTSIAASNITANTIEFTLIPTAPGTLGYVPDNSSAPSKSYILKIYLKTNMGGTQNYPITIDGKQFDFEVLAGNIGLAANSTNIVSGEKASSGSGKNVVDVTASKLSFITTAPTGTPVVGTNSSKFSLLNTNPLTAFPTSTYIYTPFAPELGIEAIDAFGNRDLGFISSISSFTNAGVGPISVSTQNNPSGPFVGGTMVIPSNFIFTTGNNTTDIQLQVSAGSLTSQSSPNIRVRFDTDSYVYADPNFVAQNFNNFVNQQAPSLPNTANATIATMAQFVLSDGGAAAYNASIAQPPLLRTYTPGGLDGAFTEISSISFDVTGTGSGDIRTLALYNNSGTKISTDQAVSSGAVTFTGLTLQALKNSTATFTIRGTFDQSIIDQSTVQFRVSAVTWSGGSQISNYNGGAGPFLGGINGGAQSLLNTIDVVATSLDFTTQPSSNAGINEPIGIDPGTGQPYSFGNPANLTLMPTTTPGIVTARDKFTNVDTGFAPPTISIRDAANNPLGLPNAFSFTSGVMNLTGMTYPQVGNGAVKIIANGIDSSVPVVNTSGTITTLTNSSTVNGAGTKFLTDINIGARINDSNGNLIGTVQSITNDLTLVLTNNAAIAVTNIAYNTNSIPSRKVDVLNVTVTQDSNNVVPGSGTPLTASLKGSNTTVYPLFGLKFTADQVVGTEPKLKGFTIGFKDNAGQNLPFENGTTVIFKDFVITKDGLANNITSISGTFQKRSSTGSLTSYDEIFVDLSANPVDLSSPVSFFLQAKADPSTNTATPNITPYFKDDGWGNKNDQKTIVSNGTASGAFEGNRYSFASTKPPILQADKKKYPGTQTNPFAGQSNVDPSIQTITLQFDTRVGSLDGGGIGNTELWNRTTNTKVADLVLDLTNTIPLQKISTVTGGTVPDVYDKLVFNIKNGPSQLTPDEVYFVRIIQGSYDPNTGKGNGITDFGLNFYSGIKDNSTLYFKVSSNKPIQLSAINSSFNTTTLGTLTTTFDQQGTAYFLVVKQGDPIPTIAEIKGGKNAYLLSHPTATVGAADNYLISSIGVAQTHTFPATYVTAQNYSVFVYAENNALPTPVPALGIFDSNLIAGGGNGPTLSFSGVISSTTNKTPISTFYKLCPDSYVTITEPMIISEAAVPFNSNFDQDFNILLPTGFQFDVTVAPKIQLIGNNFTKLNSLNNTYDGTDSVQFKYISNSLINVRFNNKNNPTNQQDFISISGFSIIGKSGSAQNNIQWFFGNNVFTTAGISTFPLAQIALVSQTAPRFNNSYWANNQFPSPDSPNGPIATAFLKTVNAIPDNYIDPSNPGAIRLLPDTRPTGGFAQGDYLASFFSGSGVSGDLLTLNAVQLGAAFNINMTHVDLNGCETITTEQYVVYDHNSPISKKLGETRNATSPITPAGTKQDISNPDFPNISTVVISPSDSIRSSETAGYTLLQLTADLPSTSIASSTSIPMSGTLWRSLIQTKILTNNSVPYNWDYGQILKADQSVIDPSNNLGLSSVYDYFKSKSLSLDRNNYWLGGSLGKIQFTGSYQSTADNQVYVPFRQEIELFVPAVPLIEITSPTPFYDKADVATMPNFNPIQYPTSNKTSGYPGTATFCEAGGIITLNAYPVASGGKSVGTFQLYDYANFKSKGITSPTGTGTITSLTSSDVVLGTGTQFATNASQIKVGTYLFDASGNEIGIVKSIQSNTQLTLTALAARATTGVYKYLDPITPKTAGGEFIDNGNGTMTFDPSSIQNAYDNILVTYTYQENNSPAVGTGYLIIRVTPNPTPKFTIASVVPPIIGADGASAYNAFCQGNQINFSAVNSSIAQPTTGKGTPSNSILNYLWNFGDPNSGLANSPATVTPIPSSGGQAGVVIDPTYIQPTAPSTQTYDMPVHIYNTSSTFTVNLTLTSKWGCSSATNAVTPTPSAPGDVAVLYGGSRGDITIGEIPTVDFSFLGNCVTDKIVFTDNSSTSGNTTAGTVAKFIWDFGDATTAFTGYNTSNPPATPPFNFPNTPDGRVNVEHIYNSANFYLVRLTTITSLGCQRSKTQQLAQLPLVSASTINGAFEQNFDTNGGGWLALDLSGASPASGGNSTWNYNTANKNWATATPYKKGEQSALYSACLDLSTVQRPMISFNTNVKVNPSEGLVVQYSINADTDNNIISAAKTWATLGDFAGGLSSGLDWYKDAGQSGIASIPFNTSGYGWTGTTGNIQPRHRLDVSGIGPNKRVLVRFALGASSTLDPLAGGGITIDNIRVGSRTRTILFENFTSTDAGTDEDLKTALRVDTDSIAKFNARNIGSTQVVNINYHIGFIGKDPFNFDNPADPSSRALFYNVSKIPYAFLDGQHSPQFANANAANKDLFGQWGQKAYDLQTLQLGKADFDGSSVTPVYTDNTNTVLKHYRINIKAANTTSQDLPKQTALFVGILEPLVDATEVNAKKISGNVNTDVPKFEYILKKMIPNAVGKRIANGQLKGTINGTKRPADDLLDENWTPERFYANSPNNKFSVVVFLQNDSTKEVYQAELNPTLTPPTTGPNPDYTLITNVITGVEPLYAENINLYPNPANQEFVIELPNALSVDSNISLVDQMGKTIDGGILPAGRTNKSVGTYDLAAGVYIVQIKTDGGDVVRKKVVIVH